MPNARVEALRRPQGRVWRRRPRPLDDVRKQFPRRLCKHGVDEHQVGVDRPQVSRGGVPRRCPSGHSYKSRRRTERQCVGIKKPAVCKQFGRRSAQLERSQHLDAVKDRATPRQPEAQLADGDAGPEPDGSRAWRFLSIATPPSSAGTEGHAQAACVRHAEPHRSSVTSRLHLVTKEVVAASPTRAPLPRARARAWDGDRRRRAWPERPAHGRCRHDGSDLRLDARGLAA